MKPVHFEHHDAVGQIVPGNPPLNLIATEFFDRLSRANGQASDIGVSL